MFVIKLILALFRSKNDKALAIASSGIAATLLPGGRTAHSALKLPLNLHSTETPTRNISKSSGMGKVLQQCKLIIWDECTGPFEGEAVLIPRIPMIPTDLPYQFKRL